MVTCYAAKCAFEWGFAGLLGPLSFARDFTCRAKTVTPAPTAQLDFFPENVRIERLDPQAVAGRSTRVDAIFVVRFEWEKGVHQVFKDHYGLYCADHGRLCRAVREVTAKERLA